MISGVDEPESGEVLTVVVQHIQRDPLPSWALMLAFWIFLCLTLRFIESDGGQRGINGRV